MNKWTKISIIVAVCIFMGAVIYMAFTYDNVPGADAKLSGVIEQYTEKAGVAERDPYINTDKGDILLFLFCFAGIVAGFYLGYNWKRITSEKPNIDKLLADKITIKQINRKE